MKYIIGMIILICFTAWFSAVLSANVTDKHEEDEEQLAYLEDWKSKRRKVEK